ncbi:hypothetical protein A7976_12320 [Methylobacillus sp. MM3]|nr:hypothetical protein A7976_12320 [Methylobacillus sp. MM3]
MYFLSFDAACKHFTVSSLDLNPDTFNGKNFRKQIELEFTRLVLVANTPEGLKQVIELGKITGGEKNPEKRISSNFLTVPLKKASGQIESYFYPRRPAAPVLKMGPTATGMKWGISYHEDWMSNFLVLLAETKSSTAALDLAVFICRDCSFEETAGGLIPALSKQLYKRFTADMANFWVSRIEKEKLLARHINTPFVDNHSPFASCYKEKPAPAKCYDQMKKADLIKRILYLECKLNALEATVK